MTSKMRVHAALRREPVDRVPIFMWFHPDTAMRLGKILEIPASCVAEVMGNDVRQTWVSNNHAMEGITHEKDGDGHVDFWGIKWVKEGPFNQIVQSPLQDADEDVIWRYPYPHAHIENLLANMTPIMAASEQFFIGCDVSPCLLEMLYRLRGMENAITDLLANPKMAMHLLAGAAAFSVQISEQACKQFALDWLWTGDDVGGQQTMMVSPKLWREMICPHLSQIVAVGKSHGLWTAYHSCGAIQPIIPDLIELGVDVLNPIQCNCPGMNPLDLKQEFGHHLSFMGGVDTQDLLPNGSAADVQRETERLIEGMTSDGGGYILAASHTVPPETPLENIFAMYQAAGICREHIEDRAADLRCHSVQ